jgi:hypothetical protein
MEFEDRRQPGSPRVLGYRRDPRWLDMSDYLVHFTPTAQEFGSILAEGRIRPGGPYGWGRGVREMWDSHSSACLSEVPLDLIDRIMGRHGNFGLAFTREFVVSRGGGRVWYLDKSSEPGAALFAAIGDLMRAQSFSHCLWKLSPFIDCLMPGRYEFDWEREWRVPGGVEFTFADVAFVITPEAGEGESNATHVLHQPGMLQFIVPNEYDAWWEAIPMALADQVDTMVAGFLSVFDSPISHLRWAEPHLWDGPIWTTEAAVDELFSQVEPSV